MKKNLLLLQTALVLSAMPAMGVDFTQDNNEFVIVDDNENECTFVGVTDENQSTIIIPDVVVDDLGREYGVTSIAEYAFRNNTDVTTIVIPGTITSIGDGAFWSCTNLVSVVIPESVTYIGHSAFYNCNNLKYIQLPSSITSLTDGVFHSCSSLETIDLPESLTEIGAWVFADCESLYEINLPANLATIGDFAFAECNSLCRIEIPESVTTIGRFAFASCENLTSVTLPANIESIGNNAFHSSPEIQSVTYMAGTPISGSADMFTDEVYANATLYVLESSLADILETSPWNMFANIKTVSIVSSIDTIAADEDNAIEVYSLSGVKLSNSTVNLATGVYIVRKGNKVTKLVSK
jgi:hypothetical protein